MDPEPRSKILILIDYEISDLAKKVIIQVEAKEIIVLLFLYQIMRLFYIAFQFVVKYILWKLKKTGVNLSGLNDSNHKRCIYS